MKLESKEKRFKRYEQAKTRMDKWRTYLQEAYDYYAPGRSNFREITKGQDRNDKIFDPIGAQSLMMFANNIQSVLMPPFRRWAELKPGSVINDPEAQQQIDPKQLDKELQQQTDTLFKFLNASNFNLAVSQALVDMGISTGALLINEGTREKPLEFTAVPIDHLSVEESAHGKIESVWRTFKMPLRAVMHQWPHAKLPSNMSARMKTQPDEEVEIIEGTIHYPDNKEEERYLYYVQLTEHKNDIVTEWRDYSPWIIFRWSVRTGETLGFGPALVALSATKVVNKLGELELKAGTFRAYPPYMVNDSENLNAYNVRIEPASLIPIGGLGLGGQDPIRPIPANGDPQFAQLQKQELEATIKEILFANPLPPSNMPAQTATEVSIRQQNWIRSSGTAFGRLTLELLEPVIIKCIKILKKFGLMANIDVNGKVVSVEYMSPLIDLQQQEDFQRIEQYIQFFMQILGPQGLAVATNPIELVEKVGQLLGVDASILPDRGTLQQMAEQAVGALQQGQQQPQVPVPNPIPGAPQQQQGAQ